MESSMSRLMERWFSPNTRSTVSLKPPKSSPRSRISSLAQALFSGGPQRCLMVSALVADGERSGCGSASRGCHLCDSAAPTRQTNLTALIRRIAKVARPFGRDRTPRGCGRSIRQSLLDNPGFTMEVSAQPSLHFQILLLRYAALPMAGGD